MNWYLSINAELFVHSGTTYEGLGKAPWAHFTHIPLSEIPVPTTPSGLISPSLLRATPSQTRTRAELPLTTFIPLLAWWVVVFAVGPAAISGDIDIGQNFKLVAGNIPVWIERGIKAIKVLCTRSAAREYP